MVKKKDFNNKKKGLHFIPTLIPQHYYKLNFLST